MKDQLIRFYLDWVNNYLTVLRLSSDTGLTVEECDTVLALGEKYHEESANVELKSEVEPFARSTKEVRKSYRHVRYKVRGFWGDDYVKADQDWDQESDAWGKPDVTWACAGRDTDEEPDGLVAAECLTAAIRDAVEFVKTKWGD